MSSEHKETGQFAHLTVNQIYELMAQRGWARIRGGSPGDDDGDDGDGDGDDVDDDDDGSGKTGSTEKKFSQADVDNAVKKRLVREKRNLTASLTDQIKTKVKSDLELEQAAKKGDLQKVIDDLKPKAERAEQLQKRLDVFEELASARFDEALAALPEALRDLAPDDDADVLERERWLVFKATPALDRLKKKGRDDDDDEDGDDDLVAAGKNGKSRSKTPGLSPRDPRKGKSSSRSVEDILSDYQKSGMYRKMI